MELWATGVPHLPSTGGAWKERINGQNRARNSLFNLSQAGFLLNLFGRFNSYLLFCPNNVVKSSIPAMRR
jgi:hypothetical protein